MALAAQVHKKTENERYRDENYPKLDPCRACYYWRGTGSSWGTYLSLPMCHYILWNDEPRGCEPDYINGTCEQFIPREGKKRGLAKFNAV